MDRTHRFTNQTHWRQSTGNDRVSLRLFITYRSETTDNDLSRRAIAPSWQASQPIHQPFRIAFWLARLHGTMQARDFLVPVIEGEEPVSDHDASRDLTANKPEPAGEKGLPFPSALGIEQRQSVQWGER